MKLRKVIKLIAQALEDLPPQVGYPEMQPDWNESVPEPIGYVYHVSPYAKEIMEQGFILDPTKTTLGAFGELNSVSTTNYENAKLYKEGIKLIVGVANNEISINDLIDLVGSNYAINIINYLMKDEVRNYWNTNFDFYALLKENPQYTAYDARDEIRKAQVVFMPPSFSPEDGIENFLRTKDGEQWIQTLFSTNLSVNGQPLSEEQILDRKWDFLKAASNVIDIPLVIGDFPEHLKTRTMDDVGIVEVAVAPTEFSKYSPRKEKGKGTYTYQPGEQEWKFYDVTDLLPVRIVGMHYLKQAIKRLADIQTDKIVKEEVIAWFKQHPNPDDDDVHGFAESLGVEPHEFEEIVYSILTEHLKNGIKLLAQEKPWMREAYDYGKATKDYDIYDIVYKELAPSWIFDTFETNEFFEIGRQDFPFPEYVTGWRYGHIPSSGRSTNYRDNKLEKGVSVMALDGDPKVKTLSEFGISHRIIVHIGGFLNPLDIGGDGEPLLLSAKEI